MEAQVRRGRGKEFYTGDMEVGQRPDIVLPVDKPIVRENESIAAIDAPIDMDYAASIAFGEEPVTIRIEMSSEKNAPKTVPVWVNGKGAEVLHDGRWVEVTYLPIGQMLTTKRKYVEVLARAKPDAVYTDSGTTNDENPHNRIVRHTSQANPFSVIEDKNPKGRAWLTKVIAEG